MNEIVFPDYEHSILNTINSILKYYNVETKYNGLKELDEKLKSKYKNVVFIILDGLGDRNLSKISPSGFFENNKLTEVTSVCPSTTTAALTTYYSGRPPIETGWISMSQYFKEYGRALEMLRKIDSYTHEPIKNAKYDVFDLVKYTTIYEQIENASPNVKAYEINPSYCDARSKRNINADDIYSLCDFVKAICNNNDENFILAYSDKPDVLLHKYGCKSDEVRDFVINAENEIEKLCIELKDTNTLVIVSADHGHKDIEKVYDIIEMDEIQDCIIMPPSFESRAITFWVKDDKKDKFEEFFKSNLGEEFILFSKKEFLEKNLLGFGEKHPKIDDFVGNYVAVSVGSSIIKLGTQISNLKGKKMSTHCGFSVEEIVVPVVVKCL